MVFSSVPPYLDHHNWHHQLQQSNNHGSGGVGGGVSENPNLPPPPPPSQPCGGGGGGGEGLTRPGSMVDRARLAKLPLPEPGLNCPRCDSTNTKFCYFNNYSLTQPRHFCKTCRRYWTRGGALRNVPVGGGCRRNKRSSKSRSSKSPSQSGAPKSLSVSPPRSSSENMTSSQLHHPPSLHLPFMSSLSQYGGAGGNLSSSIGGFQPPSEIGNFQIGSGSSGVIEAQSSSMVGGDISLKNSRIDTSQIDPPVKVEDNRGLNLSRQFLGMLENANQQSWAGNSWAEFSGVSTTTPTTHFL
ncbi:unnamed protein product [Lactuca virosa]|uniref:Dof zinc finger protein n=1 Tax=Lactuca virosa TaxID=75947 RepID=A0AAU9PB86_9ASTR|nr:unnamed protein product [Lactuca virosa]